MAIKVKQQLKENELPLSAIRIKPFFQQEYGLDLNMLQERVKGKFLSQSQLEIRGSIGDIDVRLQRIKNG